MDKIEELRQKVAKDPSSKLFVPLAEEYRKAGKLDAAIKVLQQGIERQPRYTSAVVALSKIYLEKEMFAEARAELEKVIAAVPDNLFAQRKLADIYKRLGERDLAIEQYRRALKLNPMDEEAQSILEELSKPKVETPAMPLEEAAEAPSEDEDFLLSLSDEGAVVGEGFELTEELTPIEEVGDTETEFFETFDEEAGPVDEFIEAAEEVEPLEELAEAVSEESMEVVDEAEPVMEIAEAAEEEEFMEAVEEAAPVEELVEAAEEAAVALDEAELPAVAIEAEEEAEPAMEIAEALEEDEFLEAVEEVAPVEELVGADEEASVSVEAAELPGEVFEVAAEEAVETVESEAISEEATEVVEEAEPVMEIAETYEEAAAIAEEEEWTGEILEAEAEDETAVEEVFDETGFQDLASIASDEEEFSIQKAEEFVANGQYVKAADIYGALLAREPNNMMAKQGLHELESLLKLTGTKKEVIIDRLESFLKAIMKRKNELYRNA